MTTENNHYQHLWDDKSYYFPERIDYSIKFGKATSISLLKNAVISTAEKIITNHKNVNLFLSGGLDSQAVLLGFIHSDNKHKINVKLIRFKNSLNDFDFEIGLAACKLYKINYEIIDIDYEDFLKNEYEIYAIRLSTLDPQYTLLLKILEQSTNSSVDVFGLGDFNFRYLYDRDLFIYEESEYVGRFREYCKTFIPFYRYDPNIIASWLADNNFRNFINKKVSQRDWDIFKNVFYSTHFPNLSSRIKITGFEKITKEVEAAKRRVRPLLYSKNIIKEYTYVDYLNIIKG
jgi:hypothetical protein